MVTEFLGRRALSYSVLLAAALSVSACATQRNVRGYIVDEEVMSSIQPGVDNRTSVTRMLGTPSVASTFDPNTWYYVSTQTSKFAFFREKPTNRKILQIRFADGGEVEEVQEYSLADARDINPRNAKTPTRGKKLGFFEQIFGNIGRFSGVPGGPQGPGR